MQEDAKARGDEAADWLRERFKDDPESPITMRWLVVPDDDATDQLLDLLFGPPVNPRSD